MSYGEPSALSEDWWQLIVHAVSEGKRLGVNIGFFNSPGWSQSGGPWVKSTESMRYLVSSETKFEGGRRIIQQLQKPKDIFQDVKVLAYPAPENDELTIASLKPKITSFPDLGNDNLLADGDTGTICLFTRAGNSKEIIIDFETTHPFTARTIILYPSVIPFAADVELLIKETGNFRSVKKFRFDRGNRALNVGPMPSGPVSVSLPEVTSVNFRVILNNFNLSNFLSTRDNIPANAGLAEITLSALPMIENYIEKQLGKMCQTPFPMWDHYLWEPQHESGTESMKIDPEKVLDISDRLSGNILTWDVPPGKWNIMRIGAVPTGTMNAAAAPHAMGREVDKMNRDHLSAHFNTYVGELLKRIPSEDRTALKRIVLDSYEQGSQNWTDGMIEGFQKRFGYDPVPWLTVLSGRIVASADQSDRFLWDLRRYVADRIAYDYVGGFRNLCQEQGLRIWLENYGHWGFPSEFLMYGGQSHDIAGEFWNEGDLGNIECRAASSAAHIYGKRSVSAESYTSAGRHYQRYPAMLKKRGDWSYTEGINQVILHLYIHQPYEDKNPGINAWFGTEFNRKNTWFEQSKHWIDYQRRCMFMLRRGLPVNDVCYFIGEDVPKMTGARIPELPEGYSFDYINAEVIINRLSVKNGKLLLPDGMSYEMMVLPPLDNMRPELLKKIKELVMQGAAVFGPPPKTSPSLQNYPYADEEVKTMASELWGNTDYGGKKKGKSLKGNIFNGIDIQSALNELEVLPDVSFSGSVPVLWIHRRLDDTEIYFLTNQSDSMIDFNATFRVTGRKPELWDATSGAIRDLPAFTTNKKTTTVPLKLDPYESAFIVFRKKGDSVSDRLETNFPEPRLVAEINTPWEVSFEKANRGLEQPVKMNSSEDWSQNTDQRIKYYSGTGVYRNSFWIEKTEPGENIFINLGQVGVMAEVKINGQKAGGVWTPPWNVDITNYVGEGENQVEISVVNNWINRLIGDSRLPEKERKTWINVNEIRPDDPLQASGLLGEVTVTRVRY
ncbi:MAG TPA: glycoside hydrolase family 2 [Bacteroidales bacterium]|nr:glycoside hydrolase family 2 [Bacteroidales bacterium]